MMTPASWLLEVIAKGNKQRYVPIRDESVDELRAHWRDHATARGDARADGIVVAQAGQLIAPCIPAHGRHAEVDDWSCARSRATHASPRVHRRDVSAEIVSRVKYWYWFR